MIGTFRSRGGYFIIDGRTILRRRAFACVLLAFLVMHVFPVYGAEPWPTTRFKVFAGNPFTGPNSSAVGDVSGDGFDWLEYENFQGSDQLGEEARQNIERAFTEAAVWYQNNGLPAPKLEPLIHDDEEGLYYRVYICQRFNNPLLNAQNYSNCGDSPDENKRNSGAYTSRCGNDPTRTYFLNLNRHKVLDGDQLTEVGYQTVAHELMHAIISNTAFGRKHQSCSVRYWITEGIPDAISFDLAEEIWQGRYFQNNSDNALVKRYGYRPYSQRLVEDSRSVVAPGTDWPSDFKYTASSFWRYLADSNGGWKGLLSNPKNRGLLDLTMKERNLTDYSREDWQSEITWLNRGLYGQFNQNLNEIYGLFVNNFALRIPPMANYRGRPAEETFEKWAEKLLGTCHVVDLSSVRNQTITIMFRKLAARCIWVEPTGSQGLIQVSFQATSADEGLLKDIRIGKAGTALDVKALRAKAPNISAGYLGAWIGFQQDGSKRTLYVVSNVAETPKDTKLRTIELSVSRTVITNSGLATVPLPPARVAQPPMQPSYKKHARTFVKQKSATTEMIQRQMTLDKESLNPNVNGAASISRRINQPDCTEPFRYSICGPHLTISLRLVPGTFIVPGQINTQGGVAAQTFSGMQAMAATSLNAGADMEALIERLEPIDGHEVGIAIPLIDYGYSGTISNASISVVMSGRKSLQAFGPPDQYNRTELTGSVSIEEYTPFVISGTFRAPLAEFDESGTYQSRETISGSFTSVAPWQSDERVTLEMDSIQEMADEIANTMGIPPEMINRMKEDGTMPGYSNSGSNSSSSSSSMEVGCDCECDTKPFADELCEMLCEEEFAACEEP